MFYFYLFMCLYCIQLAFCRVAFGRGGGINLKLAFLYYSNLCNTFTSMSLGFSETPDLLRRPAGFGLIPEDSNTFLDYGGSTSSMCPLHQLHQRARKICLHQFDEVDNMLLFYNALKCVFGQKCSRRCVFVL